MWLYNDPFREYIHVQWISLYVYIDGLVQDCSNSSALTMELLQSCTKTSICTYTLLDFLCVLVTTCQLTHMLQNYFPGNRHILKLLQYRWSNVHQYIHEEPVMNYKTNQNAKLSCAYLNGPTQSLLCADTIHVVVGWMAHSSKANRAQSGGNVLGLETCSTIR